jgi:hypothetical protein
MVLVHSGHACETRVPRNGSATVLCPPNGSMFDIEVATRRRATLSAAVRHERRLL